MEKTSRIPGFYKLTVKERVKKVKEFAGLNDEEEAILLSMDGLDEKTADRMIENVIGSMQLPLGVATNFLINEKDYLVPMAIEETSVVAAASNAAKMARVKGGFKAHASEPIMIGQIQILDAKENAVEELNKHKEEVLELANAQDKILVSLGGGAKDMEVRKLSDDMLCVHLFVDVRDAMGANAVNTMAEACASLIEKISGGRALLRIISNLADHRMVEATAVFDRDTIGGNKVVEDIIHAYEFASLDPYRAATHNKGIMNGIDAVAIATGNDWRAIEAGAHTYASLNGYKPLTTWEKNGDGDLVGKIKLPMAAGTIGGITKVHPMARISLKILGVKSSRELAEVIASVGLAQNFAAMHALATKGIQDGHMRLHAKNIAVMAGAQGDEIDKVAEIMASEGKIRMDRAKEILDEIRK
ncbi:MAG: hydroxymethylglutaryl-CoA reductase, degradative [Thermoplasmata archaeon]|nr:MAG: hydroxymethylglutaryl-CoA reductase, degradative [Thermoplasmata archaeon]